ncbi:hypothetical protein SK128_020931 [Halocaridina rubra]|uniref:RRM domain-containing protein n=1 Tax=Halocaridina rubra TaxID=373956 RepID=A0AAN8WVB2_HALRR
MAEGNGGGDPGSQVDGERTEDYQKLIQYGLNEKVAAKLDEIYKQGKLRHEDLDERALDALKEFPVEGAVSVLKQFLESNLEHVSNKSAYLCGVMKTYRQRKQYNTADSVAVNPGKGPDEDNLKKILERSGYALDVTTGQRKYGGPPPDWEGPPPGPGCEVFCGKIPKELYEDELIPLFEKCGEIWDLRLMMDPMTGQNRGYAFITFTTRSAANEAVKQEIKMILNTKYWRVQDQLSDPIYLMLRSLQFREDDKECHMRDATILVIFPNVRCCNNLESQIQNPFSVSLECYSNYT